MKKHILLSCFLALTLTACGDDQNKKQNSAKLSNETVTIGNGSEPESLDPHKTSGAPESYILNQMLEGLTSTDVDGNTIPGIAKSWNTTDNQTWVFHLRDAKWSNGDEVTADDFVFSFRRLADPQTASPYASYMSDMRVINSEYVIAGKVSPENLAVRAIDNKTLEIKLSAPVPYLADMLWHTPVKPVHKKTVLTYGDKWTLPSNFVNNGAYSLAEWKVNDQIVLTRNPLYYDNAKTSISRIIMLPISSQATELSRFEAGELDMTYEIPSNQYANIGKKYPNELKVTPFLCTYYYELNLTAPPFNDKKVRKAISLITDRETFATKIAGQGEIPAYQFAPINMSHIDPYFPAWKDLSKNEKIEQAKKLLAEAGYNESNPLKFELLYNTSENHKKYAIAMSAIWKQAIPFVQAELNNQEWKVYLDSRRNQKTQMSRASWCADYNEQSSFLNVLHSKNSSNYAKYDNPKFDDLLNESLKAGITTEQRAQIYKQAETLLDEDTAQLNMFHYVRVRLVSNKIKGYSLLDPIDKYQVKYWTLENTK